MKTFAKITSWVLMVVGLLTILVSLFAGIVGLVRQFGLMHIRSFRMNYGPVRIAGSAGGVVFWAALFMGLVLLGLGQVIYLLADKTCKHDEHYAVPTAVPAVAPIVIPETVPALQPVEPTKPTRSRKVARK
jgi:hypothetical protein